MIRWSTAMPRHYVTVASVSALLCAALGCTAAPSGPAQRTFATPEDAVRTLAERVKTGDLAAVIAIFGSDGQTLIDSSDPATARRSREVFTAAMAQGWRLIDSGPNSKELIVGDEDWPFPVPLMRDGDVWRFDTAAGMEEVIARRIGRNELAVIQICRTYVAAQRLYARQAHDGQAPGVFAQTFRSDPGRHNGLYWPARRGEKRSPFGELVIVAEGRPSGADRSAPAPFHGYFFKILTAQGAAAPGGPKDYLVNGNMSGGFALVAWPAQYDVTGVMTFVVNHEGIVHEKDLGVETTQAATLMTHYNPDASWRAVQ
jgi:hypothetical protein